MTRSGLCRKLFHITNHNDVLIPLLVDDPLWGFKHGRVCVELQVVLIPLLVDDPLWAFRTGNVISQIALVLIPLLVDDPLWVSYYKSYRKRVISLNPSFSG